jgi:hypothetical protein
MKHVRYIPQYNESEFKRMAKRADRVLIARRNKAQGDLECLNISNSRIRELENLS